MGSLISMEGRNGKEHWNLSRLPTRIFGQSFRKRPINYFGLDFFGKNLKEVVIMPNGKDNEITEEKILDLKKRLGVIWRPRQPYYNTMATRDSIRHFCHGI